MTNSPSDDTHNGSALPRVRARDLGIVIGDHPTGPYNAITDVAGARVGHTTLCQEGPPAVNTGVTVVIPHDDIWSEPVFAGAHRLNGSGEMTGLEWIRESGELTTAIGLTNTHSVGVVRDALVDAQVAARGEGCTGRCRSSGKPTTGCSMTSTATTCGPNTYMPPSRRRATGLLPRATSVAEPA